MRSSSNYFNPRSPKGERLLGATPYCNAVAISIHALRKESDQVARRLGQEFGISIHALRKESDIVFVDFIGCVVNFNPRSP